MRNLLISVAILGGSICFLSWYSKKKKNKEASVEQTNETATIIDLDTGEVETDFVDISKTTPKQEQRNSTDAIDYSSFSGEGKKDIKEESEKEEYRINFEETSELAYEGGEHDNMTSEEHFIDNCLRSVDKIYDTEIWTIMAALFGYEFDPTAYQKNKEFAIIEDIRRERVLYFNDEEGYSDFYGTAAEIILYFARAISDNTGKSIAGVLEYLLKNGGFLECIDFDGKDISIDNEQLRKRVEDLFTIDCEDTRYNIFGKRINTMVKGLTIPERSWLSQLDLYLDNAFKLTK